MRTIGVVVLVAVVGLGLGLPAPATIQAADKDEAQGFQAILTPETQSVPSTGRIMVLTRSRPTTDMVEQLKQHGTVHGVNTRRSLVAVTPSDARGRSAIARLGFVSRVEDDVPRFLHKVGSWDRDILDVVDVEENNIVGDPDPREVAQTGAGVHVAVIDTGLIENWRDFFFETSIRTDLARAFMGGGAVAEDFVPGDEFNTSNPTNLWERDTNSHGTAVASHVIGFKIGTRYVDGTAPAAKVIPLKVFPNGEAFTWSSRIIAAIDYVTWLKQNGYIGPVAINMSLGGGPARVEREAIADAISAGVIVVASAGNAGEEGMGWPGAYPEVISAGATGWTLQFRPGTVAAPNRAFWWTRNVGNDPDGTGTSEELQSYVTFFSSRAIPQMGTNLGVDPQQLDVLAPGLWTVAPGGHGPTSAFFFWGGTSFSSPLVAGVVALMLEKNPTLIQYAVETILKASALPMAANDSRPGILEPFIFGAIYTATWDDDCDGLFCDPVGAGLMQADKALQMTP